MGRSQAEVDSLLATAGLQRGSTQSVRTGLATRGTVFAQLPAVGDLVPPGTAVTIVAERRPFLPAAALAVLVPGFLLLLGVVAYAAGRRRRPNGSPTSSPPLPVRVRPGIRPVTGAAAGSYDLQLPAPLFRGPVIHARSRAEPGEVELVVSGSLIKSGDHDG